MFGTATAILLNDIARDWRDVAVVLFELFWSLRRFWISCTTAKDNAEFPVGIAIGALLFQKISVLLISAIKSFDSLAELVDLLRLAQILKNGFFVLVALELFDQLLDLVLATCILLFNCRKCHAKNSVVNGVVPGFPVTLRFAGWIPRWSCVLVSLILLTAARIRFEYNPWHSWSQANLLLELLLRFRTYRVLNANGGQCVLENDCMWPCLVKLHVFLLSELQIAPIYRFLKAFPSILVWSDPWFRQVAWSSLHTILILHWIHCGEKHGLSSSFEASLSWNQSSSDYWVQFIRVPGVDDVLGKSFR